MQLQQAMILMITFLAIIEIASAGYEARSPHRILTQDLDVETAVGLDEHNEITREECKRFFIQNEAEKKAEKNMRYILLTGGTAQGLGKGQVAGSLGTVLNAYGLRATVVTMGPVMNSMNNLLSPFEKGEFYALRDGCATGANAGIAERMMRGVYLHHSNYLTIGSMYADILSHESSWSQLSADFNQNGNKSTITTDDVIRYIEATIRRSSSRSVEKDEKGNKLYPDVAILDLGGIIGNDDLKLFMEALNIMRTKLYSHRDGKKRLFHIHIDLLLQLKKFADDVGITIVSSIKTLRLWNLDPDVVILRTAEAPTNDEKSKRSLTSLCQAARISPLQVIRWDREISDYQMPLMIKESIIIPLMFRKFQSLPRKPNLDPKVITDPLIIDSFTRLALRYHHSDRSIKVAIVGKYAKDPISYLTIKSSIEHAVTMMGYKSDIIMIETQCLEEKERTGLNPGLFFQAHADLRSAQAIVMPGGAAGEGTEGMRIAVRYARDNNIPLVGICLGMQFGVTEFFQDVIGMKNAGSNEEPGHWNPAVIDHMAYRMGIFPIYFLEKDSLFSKLYKLPRGLDFAQERFAQGLGFQKQFRGVIRRSGLFPIVGDKKSWKDSNRTDGFEMSRNSNDSLWHPYFVLCSFHPEFESMPLEPHPLFVGLAMAAINRLDEYLSKKDRLSIEDYDNEIKEEVSEGSNFPWTIEHEPNLLDPLEAASPADLNDETMVMRSSPSLRGGIKSCKNYTFILPDEWFTDWNFRWETYLRLIPDDVKKGSEYENKSNVNNMKNILKNKDSIWSSGESSRIAWMPVMEDHLNFHSRFVPMLWNSVPCGTKDVRVDCGQVHVQCIS